MTYTYRELRALSMDELVGEYDSMASHTQPGLAFFRDEIMRRQFDEQNNRMLNMTQQIRTLTWIIAGLTLLNIVFVAWTIFHV